MEAAIVTVINMIGEVAKSNKELFQAQTRTEGKLNELIEAQANTEKRLNIFINVVERHINEGLNGTENRNERNETSLARA